MIETPPIQCWFIGGPWNNRLVPIAPDMLSAMFICVPLPIPFEKQFYRESIELVPIDAVTIETVDYYRQAPLEGTGYPVYSCLEGAATERGGTIFGLKSVK